MTVATKLQIMDKKLQMDNVRFNVGEKDGIPIEKGIILNEEYLLKNFKHLEDLANYFTSYPDLYLDLITPEDSEFKLFFYQESYCAR